MLHSPLIRLSLILFLGMQALPSPALAAASAATPAPHPVVASSRRLAVMPFENLSRQPQDAWLAEAFADSLTLALAQLDGLQVVERARMHQLVKELSFGQSDWVDPARSPEMGKLSGATQMVMGSFQHHGDQLSVAVRLVDVETGALLSASITQVQGSYADLFALQKDLARQLVGHLQGSAQNQLQVASVLETEASTEAQRWFTLGQQALLSRGSEQKLLEAIAAFEQAIALSPAYGRAHAGLAEAYALRAQQPEIFPSYRPDDADRALAAAARALALAPELAAGYRARARVRQSRKQDAEAREDLSRALALEPGNSQTILALLRLEHADLGNAAQMRERLQQLGANFDDPWIQVGLAQASLAERSRNPLLDLAPARQLLLQAQQKLPDNFLISYLLGMLAVQAFDFAQAEAHLTRAYALEPGLASLWALAQVKQYQNQLPEARELFARVLILAPKHPYAHQAMGDVQRALGQIEPARASYRQAIALAPDEPDFYASLAWLEAAGNPAQAQALMQQALGLTAPGSVEQAWILMYLGDLSDDPAASRALYARAREGKVPGHLVMLRLARLAVDQQDYAEARRQMAAFFAAHPDMANRPAYQAEYKAYYLLDAIAADPGNGLLYNDLALLAQAEGDTANAEKNFARAIALASSHPVIFFNAGSFALVQQQPELARKYLERAVGLDPAYVKAWYNLALTWIALKEPVRAREALTRVLSLDPGHQAARKALDDLHD